MLALGGIAEKVLAAHRGGLGRVLLPLGNRRQVDEDLDDGSGARSSSTTSRGTRSWVHLALHREEVVEPHP